MTDGTHTSANGRSGCLPVQAQRRALTRQQLAILAKIQRGMTYKEIASDLYMSERTVRREVARMKEIAGAPTIPVLVSRLGSP